MPKALAERDPTISGPAGQIKLSTIFGGKGNKHNLKFDGRRKEIYLLHLAKSGAKMASAQAAGVGVDTVAQHRKKDPEFAALEARAAELYIEQLERAVDERAFLGLEEFVISKGEVVYHDGKPLKKKVFSDTLATLRLKALAPERYRENVKIDADVRGGVLVVPAEMTVEEWEQRERERMLKASEEAKLVNSD